MSEASDAIRERFEIARRTTTAKQALRDYLRSNNLAKALAVADALGDPLPRNQVVHVDFARARA